MKSTRIGCSGWSYKDWRGVLYPPGVPTSRWLECYASHFDTVEVNATFYGLPKEETVRNWAAQVPDDFLFAVKASRYLTHVRRLKEIGTALKRFWAPLEPLRESGKLGPVLWQLPESFHRDDATLEGALAKLPKAQHCFEFRHASWFSEDVYSLLERHGASLVLPDDARRELPRASPAGPIVYLRLHYGGRGRDGNYSERELDTWRRRVAAWRAKRDVFVYLNNDWNGFAPRNAESLQGGRRPASEAKLVTA
jgi:uncharacterized protein YecE (DUF72 family)